MHSTRSTCFAGTLAGMTIRHCPRYVSGRQDTVGDSADADTAKAGLLTGHSVRYGAASWLLTAVAGRRKPETEARRRQGAARRPYPAAAASSCCVAPAAQQSRRPAQARSSPYTPVRNLATLHSPQLTLHSHGTLAIRLRPALQAGAAPHRGCEGEREGRCKRTPADLDDWRLALQHTRL